MMCCSACEEPILRVNLARTRCEHELHNYCIPYKHPKLHCVVCTHTITEEFVLRYDENDQPCHTFCKKHAQQREIKRCPICGEKATQKNKLTNGELEELLKKIDGLDYEKRLEVYKEFGFNEEECKRPELTDEDWERILQCMNPLRDENEELAIPKTSLSSEKKPFVIPEPKTYEPRELAQGERYKPPNRSRKVREHGEFLKSVVPKSVKERVHDDLSLFKRPI